MNSIVPLFFDNSTIILIQVVRVLAVHGVPNEFLKKKLEKMRLWFLR